MLKVYTNYMLKYQVFFNIYKKVKIGLWLIRADIACNPIVCHNWQKQNSPP